MERSFKEGLDQVKASEQLKQSTRIYLEQYRYAKTTPKRAWLVWAAVCMLLIFTATSYSAWQTWLHPVAFISVDVNPSVELAVNSRDKVVEARGFNEEGVQQLELLSPKGMPYQKAVTLLLEQEIAAGYLNSEGMVAFSVQAGDAAREQQMLDALESCVDALPLQVSHHSCRVDEQVRLQAIEQGISPGRYQAILDLMEVDPAATWEECRHSTVPQLLERTEACGNGGKKDSGHSGRHHR